MCGWFSGPGPSMSGISHRSSVTGILASSTISQPSGTTSPTGCGISVETLTLTGPFEHPLWMMRDEWPGAMSTGPILASGHVRGPAQGVGLGAHQEVHERREHRAQQVELDGWEVAAADEVDVIRADAAG